MKIGYMQGLNNIYESILLFFIKHTFTLTMNERFSLDGGYIGEFFKYGVYFNAKR